MLRLNWPAARLSTYLALIALLACAPLCTWMAWQTVADVREREQRLADDLTARTSALAAAVDADLNRSVDALAMLVASGWLQRLPDADVPVAQPPAAAAPPAQAALPTPGSAALQTSMATTASSRTALAPDASLPLLPPGWLGLFLEAADGTAAVRLDSVAGNGSGSDRVALSVAGDAQRRLGVWITTQHWQALLQRTGAPTAGVAAVFDNHNRIIARTQVPSSFVGGDLSASAIGAMAHQPDGVARVAVLDGPPALSAWQRLPGNGWGVAVSSPADPFWRVVLASVGPAVAGAAGCLLLGLGLAWWVARQVASPVAQLARAASGREDGEAVLRLPRSPVREVVALQLALGAARVRETASARTLQQRAREFETVFDTSPVALAICLDGICSERRQNRAMQALLDELSTGDSGAADGTGRTPPTSVVDEPIRGKRQPRRHHPAAWHEQLLVAATSTGVSVPLHEEALDLPPPLQPRWLLVCAEPLVDDEGSVGGAVAAAVDVTALKLAQQRLAEAHGELARAQQLIDAAQTAAGVGFFHYAFDRDVVEGSVGHAAVLRNAGLDAAPAAEPLQPWLQRFAPAHAALLQSHIDALGERQDTAETVLELADVGAASRHLTVRMHRSQAAPGAPRTLIGVIVDTSEQHRAAQSREQVLAAEQQARLVAEAASAAKDSLLNMLGHELRNPLNGLAAAAEVLKLVGLQNPLARDAQQVIERQGQELSRLVNEFLDMARITSDQHPLAMAPLDLAALAREALALPQLHHGTTATVQLLAPAPAWIKGHHDHLLQALRKIIEHAALQHGAARGLSMVIDSSDTVPAAVTLLLRRDDATGADARFDMDTAALPDATSRQLATAAEPAVKTATGTGAVWRGAATLGMEWVATLVALHGASLSLGNGSDRAAIELRFTGIEPPDAAQRTGSTSLVEHPRTVLIIEDNQDAALSLRLALELLGHRIEACGDGQEGLRALLARPPEVAVIDIGLPDISGLTVARQARAAGYAGRLLGVSGYAAEETSSRALKAGFDDYMSKPLNMARLARWIAGRAG